MCVHGQPGDPAWFERLPELVAETVERQFSARARFDPLDTAALLTVVGRGLQLATAYETALKVRELSALAAEAFSLPDLLHGPIAALRSTRRGVVGEHVGPRPAGSPDVRRAA